jgi:hypothetical protein
MTTETLESSNQTETSHSEQQKALTLKVPNHSSLLPGNRPVESRHLQIVNTYSSVGSSRPITKSHLDIKGSLSISGMRPITSSHLKISKDYQIMGHRPVASNQIDDPSTLMGFLD